MKYINLIEKLSEQDKQKLNLFIQSFGCSDHFIGLDEWLEDWSHANQKLYRLLGNSFIKEFPFEYEKDEQILTFEIKELNNDVLSFYEHYRKFYLNVIREKREEWGLTQDDLNFIRNILEPYNLIDNKINYHGCLKIKKPNANKMLQIQENAKPLRAITRIMEYFKDDWDWNIPAFEDYRKRHAIILSEKTIKGTVALSIHPLDYLTMSDNSSNWTSCMSWQTHGCYHVGTVEMMNSNNVICAYLKNSSRPYVFNGEAIDEETGEVIGVWNNKRWRQLVYVTKDIIMTGKPYPYTNKDLSFKILEHTKDLAKENLGWNYTYGPERYEDMKYVGSAYRMDKQRDWIRAKSFKKHNILWDTKGMYNDMLNDPLTYYWCYRNKVEHTKIISVSGKSKCLCCGESSLEYDSGTDDYNERYYHVSEVICNDCLDKYFTCAHCNGQYTKGQLTETPVGKLCKYCLKSIKHCPECDNIFFIESTIGKIVWNHHLYKDIKENPQMRPKVSFQYYTNYRYDWDREKQLKIEKELKKYHLDEKANKIVDIATESLYCCPFCELAVINRLKKNAIAIDREMPWRKDRKETIYLVNPEEAEKFRYPHLKDVKMEDIKSIKMDYLNR